MSKSEFMILNTSGPEGGGQKSFIFVSITMLCISSLKQFWGFDLGGWGLAGVGCGMKCMERLFIPANPSQLFNQCKICICWQKQLHYN